MQLRRFRDCLLFLLGVFYLSSAAPADDFPQPYNRGVGADADPLAALEAAEGFRLPPGFRATLFAAEPGVQNPVAMAWDGRGRLWVAEYYTYADRSLKFDLSLRDRVVILADNDGDGRADERKVFCDNVQRLTSIEVGLGGVWLLCMPRLLFIPDRDGDDIPDGPPEVVLDGFETFSENYHNCANGLRWGPDGWLYGRCGASSPSRIGAPGANDAERTPLYGGLWRYHPRRRVFETICHGTTNPWGHDWDAHGELFFTNTVTGHLFHVNAGAHYTRSATVTPNPRVYEPINTQADHLHWDTGSGISYRNHEHEQLGGGHAHCGALIYLADQWPAEYRERLLTLNFHGRRMNVDRLDRAANGFVARHEPDICFAKDDWFRGIDLSCGPEGAVYVLDWSDTGECHEHEGIHRSSGRVFRIAYGDGLSQPPPELTKYTELDLANLHNSTNEWLVRQARRELANRAAAGSDVQPAVDELRNLYAKSGDAVVEKLRALWTLYTLDEMERNELLKLLDHSNEHMRAWAIRLLVDFWPLDTVLGEVRATRASIDPQVSARLVELARTEPPGLPRLVLASTLQRLPLELRPAVAEGLLRRPADNDDQELAKLIWYGLAPLVDEHAAALVPLAIDSQLSLVRQWIAQGVSADPAERAAELDQLIRAAAEHSEPVRADVVAGLTAGLAGHRQVDQPPSWPALAASLRSAVPEVRQQARSLSVVFGDGRALDEVRRLALDNRTPLVSRRAALETLIAARPADLREICEELLRVRFLNMTALDGLTLFEDAEIGHELARRYRSFHPSERYAVVDALVSRPSFAGALLDAIDSGEIPAAELSAAQARRVRSFGDEQLAARLSEVWGELRDSPADKAQAIDRLKQQLTAEYLSAADLPRGRAVFQKACANCHRLYGAGGEIGPDLTGAGRQNLDYLLSNIIDPSAVVNKDYRMSIVQHADGRVLNGIVVSQDDARIVLQTEKEKFTLLRDDIEAIQQTVLSAMPDSILQPLADEEVRDLIAYLMSTSQVEAPAVGETMSAGAGP